MQPATHPTKPLRGTDGQTYHRRADISMRLYKAYVDSAAEPKTIWDEAFWIGLFLGLIPESALALDLAARATLALESVTTDVYFAVRDTLLEDITSPAVPFVSASADASRPPNADATTAPAKPEPSSSTTGSAT